jgi:hypothetical protein
MANPGQKGRSEPAASAAAWSVCAPGLALVAPRAALLPDSLHCGSDVSGSAVQFNSSVSAMPATRLKDKSTPSPAGTADYTLLVRWQ